MNRIKKNIKSGKVIFFVTLLLLLAQGVINVNASESAQSKKRLVQVLYVIPKGQTAKPGANQVFAAIMKILQKHYHEQLGVTFGLKSPLVTTTAISEDAAAAIDWNKNAKLVKTVLADDYVNNENIVITVLEGTSGDPGGSWNIVKMTGGLWNEAYKTYQENPDNLPNFLHGWSHELGHAFGLFHTSDAKPCFAKKGVDLGKLPSLIMQKGEDKGAVYNYPFLEQEKKMLLDPDYMPECRSLLNEPGAPARPHSSLHLRYSNLAMAPKPPAPRYVTLDNQAGYVAEMTIMYNTYYNIGGVNVPMPAVEKTGEVSFGFRKRIEVPSDIPNLPINVFVKGFGTNKNDLLSTNLSNNFNGTICYKIWGTIFSPQIAGC